MNMYRGCSKDNFMFSEMLCHKGSIETARGTSIICTGT